MQLEYPKYEILFAVQDEKDEAIPVVRMLMEKYPDIRAKLIVGKYPGLCGDVTTLTLSDKRKVGVNPKVNNLMAPFEQASFDLLWVIDATIAVQPATLGRAVDAFLGTSFSSSSFHADLEDTPLLSDDMRAPPGEGEVGLVHYVPYAVAYQRTWGSLIEQAFLNTTHAKMYTAIVGQSSS